VGEHVDVLIVGAGLSGIGAAAQLARELPDHSYLVLESRDTIGGTWDLFRYPGVRSDSDMFTLGYRFKPWHEDSSLADAEPEPFTLANLMTKSFTACIGFMLSPCFWIVVLHLFWHRGSLARPAPSSA